MRDGDQFDQRSGQFSKEESYKTALLVSDYIILDFRANGLRETHIQVGIALHCNNYDLTPVPSLRPSKVVPCRIQ